MAKDANQSNGFSCETVQNLVNRIENLFADIDELRAECRESCKPIREDIRAVYLEAEGRGVPKDELQQFVKARMKLAGARKALAKLETDQRETVEMLALAFGDARDLPLFEHRMRSAEEAAQEVHAS